MHHNSSSLMKVRVYPSLDFTLGQKFPPKPDTSQDATEIERKHIRRFYGDSSYLEIHTNERAVDRAVIQVTKGRLLSPEKSTQLLEAYETEYQNALAEGNTERAEGAIAKIERLSLCPSLLGLSVATNSHSPSRKRRGLSGITPYAKRMVRSGLALLERKYGRDRLTLGTCTLPAMTEDEFEHICSNWAELVRQFFQELTRELIRKGLEAEYVQVTEIQEKRFSDRGEVGLHLHWLIPGKKKRFSDWAFKPDEVRNLWCRILSNMLGRDASCDSATRIEKPRTSLMREMSKYLSKGCTAIASVIKAGKENQLPSAWWGANKSLKTQVKSEIIELSGLAALWLDRKLRQHNPEKAIWHVDIWIEKDGREFRAGAVGQFNSQKEVNELKMMHEVLSIQDGYNVLELFS